VIHEGEHPHHSYVASEIPADNAPVSVFSMVPTTIPVSVSAPAPALPSVAEPVIESSYFSNIKPIGTLDMTLLGTGDELDSNVPEADPLKLLARAGGFKKPSTAHKKASLGAKKLSIGGITDNRMESFETLEKRSQQAKTEEERGLSKSMMQMDLKESSSGRIATMLRDSEALTFPAHTTTSLSPKPVTSTTSKPATAESYQAREKYGAAKGISSDQFFGRDDQVSQEARNRLDMYSNSTSISSDMLKGGRDERFGWDGNQSYDPSSASLDRLKDSVSGFFDGIQRRLG
jgi:hypothetical protein